MAKYFNFFPKTLYTNSNTSSSGLDIVTNIISRFNFESTFKDNISIFYDYEIRDSDTPEIIAHKYYKNAERHWIVLVFNDIIDPNYDWPLTDQNLINYVHSKYSGVSNVSIVNGGSGYSNGYLTLTTTDGIGSGSSVYYTANSTTGTIETVEIINKGNGYKKIPTATANGGVGAIFSTSIINGINWAQNINNVKAYYKIIIRTSSYDQTKIIEKIEITANEYANTGISSKSYTLQDGVIVTENINTEISTYYQYETELNDAKRKIKLIKPEFVPAIEKEFRLKMK